MVGWKAGREGDIHEPHFTAASDLSRDIDKELIVFHAIFEDTNASLLLHYEEASATVAGVRDLHREFQVFDNQFPFELRRRGADCGIRRGCAKHSHFTPGNPIGAFEGMEKKIINRLGRIQLNRQCLPVFRVDVGKPLV